MRLIGRGHAGPCKIKLGIGPTKGVLTLQEPSSSCCCATDTCPAPAITTLCSPVALRVPWRVGTRGQDGLQRAPDHRVVIVGTHLLRCTLGYLLVTVERRCLVTLYGLLQGAKGGLRPGMPLRVRACQTASRHSARAHTWKKPPHKL